MQAAPKPDLKPFVLTRFLDAPREAVFKAWTQFDRLKQWWGPKGFVWLGGHLDLKPGGIFHYHMRAPNGADLWGRFVYRDIAAPERLVFIVSFSDEKAGVARAPFSATWPLEVLNTVAFADEGGRTRLTLVSEPVTATPDELASFEAMLPSMTQGWTGTMDQLAEFLAKAAGR